MKLLLSSVLCTTLFWAPLIHVSQSSLVSTGNFREDFPILFIDDDHVRTSSDGHLRILKLDKESGSGFMSNQSFLFGEYEMQIKLVKGHSEGTVVTFWLSSSDLNYTTDEIYFRFFGNQNGRDYILQTDVFTNGHGEREENFHLWFDPTTDFHNYTILWNTHIIVFLVDEVPIRVYKNHVKEGVEYPKSKPMNLLVYFYERDPQQNIAGIGRDHIDWSKAPFVSSFKDFKIDACVWIGSARECSKASDVNWWNKDDYAKLTYYGKQVLKEVRKKQLVYNYCQDTERFHAKMPSECYLSQY